MSIMNDKSKKVGVNNFPGGVWPVMITPFTKEGNVDYNALKSLVNWYISGNVSGLFAVCQSSEMFYLSIEERVKIAECVVEAANGRIPVICSGHISDALDDQVEELNRLSKTGIDALILITNRLAKEDESDKVWQDNCKTLLEQINPDIPLGFYECPYPYKRLLSIDNIKWCAESGRFFFLKDTSCDESQIEAKLLAIKGSELKLYNANTTTLLESLRKGGTGYSGVMANFHPKLYAWLCDNYQSVEAEELSDALTIASMIERQYYPVNAKYHLQAIEGLKIETSCRVKNDEGLTETFKKEVHMLDRICKKLEAKYYL